MPRDVTFVHTNVTSDDIATSEEAPNVIGGDIGVTWKKNLAGHLRARRIVLGLTQAEAAERAGLSRQYWIQLEQGRQRAYQRSCLLAAGAALGWTYESIDAVLAGGEPMVIRDQDRSLQDAVAHVAHQVDALVSHLGAPSTAGSWAMDPTVWAWRP